MPGCGGHMCTLNLPYPVETDSRKPWHQCWRYPARCHRLLSRQRRCMHFQGGSGAPQGVASQRGHVVSAGFIGEGGQREL